MERKRNLNIALVSGHGLTRLYLLVDDDIPRDNVVTPLYGLCLFLSNVRLALQIIVANGKIFTIFRICQSQNG